jgi:hypothetical protein
VEAYYNFAIARSARLTFDFQWTRSVLQAIDDAIVLGVRLDLSL